MWRLEYQVLSFYAKSEKNTNSINAIKSKVYWLTKQEDILMEIEKQFKNLFNGPHQMKEANFIHLKKILKQEAKEWM